MQDTSHRMHSFHLHLHGRPNERSLDYYCTVQELICASVDVASHPSWRSHARMCVLLLCGDTCKVKDLGVLCVCVFSQFSVFQFHFMCAHKPAVRRPSIFWTREPSLCVWQLICNTSLISSECSAKRAHAINTTSIELTKVYFILGRFQEYREQAVADCARHVSWWFISQNGRTFIWHDNTCYKANKPNTHKHRLKVHIRNENIGFSWCPARDRCPWLIHAYQRSFNVVVIQKLGGVSGILRKYPISLLKYTQSTQRDIL